MRRRHQADGAHVAADQAFALGVAPPPTRGSSPSRTLGELTEAGFVLTRGTVTTSDWRLAGRTELARSATDGGEEFSVKMCYDADDTPSIEMLCNCCGGAGHKMLVCPSPKKHRSHMYLVALHTNAAKRKDDNALTKYGANVGGRRPPPALGAVTLACIAMWFSAVRLILAKLGEALSGATIALPAGILTVLIVLLLSARAGAVGLPYDRAAIAQHGRTFDHVERCTPLVERAYDTADGPASVGIYRMCWDSGCTCYCIPSEDRWMFDSHGRVTPQADARISPSGGDSGQEGGRRGSKSFFGPHRLGGERGGSCCHRGRYGAQEGAR